MAARRPPPAESHADPRWWVALWDRCRLGGTPALSPAFCFTSVRPLAPGPKGGYKCFGGRDATRAFQTGKFTEDLTDDVSDFTDAQMAAVVEWATFYREHKASPVAGWLAG
jgi:hypothetical protein